ncbi:unnamed protein product [Durusdinium trenchii]|uniref:Uncharacterized protein n=2 Tax=Durusdinium trenchii TaxID=1381693 RepID=A0ABP0R8V0_9DINO
MAGKLPSHLASFLRHQPVGSTSSQQSAADTGKAARKKAARVKRRAKAKDDRAADRAEKAEQKKRQSAAAVTEKPSAEEFKHVPRKKALKKKQQKRHGAKESKKSAKKAVTERTETEVKRSFDPEGAERDAALLSDLEKKLGLAGNDKRKRKEEKQMFEDLGFDAEDLGIEELPSSDNEDAPSQTSELVELKDQDMMGLIDSILGQSGATMKAKGAKKRLKPRGKARA